MRLEVPTQLPVQRGNLMPMMNITCEEVPEVGRFRRKSEAAATA